MTKNQKLVLLVLISMMGCSLGSAVPVQAATTITSEDQLTVEKGITMGGATYSYDIYIPESGSEKVLKIQLESFSPNQVEHNALFGHYTNEADAQPITGINMTVDSTGGTSKLEFIAAAYSETGNVGSYSGPTGDDEKAGTTDSPSNIVTIAGGTASNAMGGYSYSGAVTNNELNLKDAAQVNNAYGGYGGTNSVTHNVVNVDLPNNTESVNLYGGQANSGDASYNKVEVTALQTGGIIYGGLGTNTGQTNGNTVILHDGLFYLVYGGGGGNTADENTVTIEKGTVTSNITGGDSQYGISASGNMVTIGDVALSQNGWVIGGRAPMGNNADSNTVKFIGSTDKTITYTPYMVYGGSSNGTANNNKVIVGKNSILNAVSKWVLVGRGVTEAKNNALELNGTLAESQKADPPQQARVSPH